MRVLVCGSREWTDAKIIWKVLNGYFLAGAAASAGPMVTLIEGGAMGADALAGQWADASPHSCDHLQFPADWEKHGKAAGPIRNQRMLDEGKPDVVIAFKDGFQRDPCQHRRTHLDDGVRYCDDCGWAISALAGARGRMGNTARGGTEDMVRRAKAAGIPVYIVSHG